MTLRLFSFMLLCLCVTGAAAQINLMRPAGASKDSLSAVNSKKVIVADILIVGNKATRPFIITRELIFHVNDTLPRYVLDEAMSRSRENLLNSSLFNFVEIIDQPDANDSMRTHVIVRVSERWYLWPLPIFELVDRNFNEWWLTKDFARTNYGAYITRENFRGRKEKLSILLRLGYSQRLGMYYTIPYINRKQINGLAFGITYTRNHEIAYGLKNSKLAYFKSDAEHVRRQFGAGLTFTHRDGIHNYHAVSAEFQNNRIADSIALLNADYFLRNETTQQLTIINYQYKCDYRDIKVYPLKGFYFDFEAYKIGIGTFRNEPDLLAFTSNYRRYWEVSPRWHFAMGAKGKISGRTFAPYYNQRGLGYGSDYIRGYEFYVIGGQHYALFKSNLKFTLIPEKIISTPVIPLEKFNRIPFAVYLNVFYDAGYVRDRQFAETSPLSNSYQHGAGIGIDYVTYYDLVFRMEYAINKLNEHGLYLHFSAPIF